MEILLTLIHVAVSLFLVFVVLLQSGQAADLAGAFGGGGSQTALGMRGAATLLQKLTTAAAVIFMLTSLGLGIVGRSERSVIEGLEPSSPVEQQPPATPETPGAQPGQGTDGPAKEASTGQREAGDSGPSGDSGQSRDDGRSSDSGPPGDSGQGSGQGSASQQDGRQADTGR